MNIHSNAFNDPAADYARVVEVVRAMKPQNVPPTQVNDVVMLLEWLQAQVLAQHDELVVMKTRLEQKELVLAAERNQAALTLRAANAVLATGKAKSVVSRLLGR
jgi:hypothetical protein